MWLLLLFFLFFLLARSRLLVAIAYTVLHGPCIWPSDHHHVPTPVQCNIYMPMHAASSRVPRSAACKYASYSWTLSSLADSRFLIDDIYIRTLLLLLLHATGYVDRASSLIHAVPFPWLKASAWKHLVSSHHFILTSFTDLNIPCIIHATIVRVPCMLHAQMSSTRDAS